MTIVAIVCFMIVCFVGYAIIETPKLQQSCDEIAPGSTPYSPPRTAELYCKDGEGILYPLD